MEEKIKSKQRVKDYLDKKVKGQFFTISNPFHHNLFYQWMERIPNLHKQKILEPFAGSNNITEMISPLGFENNWVCFDIDEKNQELNINKKFPIFVRDTIKDFPKGFDVIITNPPYLAKNSATRSGIPFPDNYNYDDLYKISLDLMLNNSKYVAAIIPESFITQNIFHERLYGVISLTMKMFDDTDCPVCLALFVPTHEKEDKDDFLLYSGEKEIGTYKEINNFLIKPTEYIDLEFNNKNGEIGLYALDNVKSNSITFVLGEDIDPDLIRHSSRSITRIKIKNKTNIDLNKLIEKSNTILNESREKTHDLFLTPFKGLRKDGRYRRRLDFKNAKRIISLAYKEIER